MIQLSQKFACVRFSNFTHLISNIIPEQNPLRMGPDNFFDLRTCSRDGCLYSLVIVKPNFFCLIYKFFYSILSFVLVSFVTCQLSSKEKSFVYMNVEQELDWRTDFFTYRPLHTTCSWLENGCRQAKVKWRCKKFHYNKIFRWNWN